MPAVEEHLPEEDDEAINRELLNTIKIPRNMKLLQGKLPKSQYEEDKLEERDNVEDLLQEVENVLNQPNGHSNSVSNIHDTPQNEYMQGSMPSTTTNKETEQLVREIRSRHGLDQPENNEMKKKKRKNPRTTPMNLELVDSNKSKKYQMYRNLNSQSRKNDISDISSIRNNYNIPEKYLQRAKEIEAQEKKLKKELQSRIDDPELPQIYKRSKVGIQRVLYDPRYENNSEHTKHPHNYGIESENNRKPSLMLGPRIISHNSKESISSRGNIAESMSPPSSKGLYPYGQKIHPYKNGYSVKNYKLVKMNGGLPPSSKYNGK
jgi:hypothetical protein